MRWWFFTVGALALVMTLISWGVFGKDMQGWGLLILIFAGPYVVFELVFWLIRIGWRAKFGEPVIETTDKLTEREIRTKLIRQWIYDQKTGGPLYGTPRPLTLEEEKTAS